HNGQDSPQQVKLTGTGTQRQVPILNVEPRNLNFGKIEIEKRSTKQISIINKGSAPLNLRSTNLNNKEFRVIKNNCPDGTSIEPGNNCQITIGFKPTTEGEHEGILEITHNGQDSPQQVKLTGTGTQPPVILYREGSSTSVERNITKVLSQEINFTAKS
ncbi:MAG: choice-of-anchor D domain-containing protein, partial [Scytonema sp. PMC 1070.18]|nr:choice-of-anchor D domain-containing protein [Scytonema sp. PMC 1070.18]